MIIYPSRVQLSIDHDEKRDASGQPAFVLSITATDPEGFPPYLDGTDPHCCFVYQRGSLNVLNEAKLVRIATLDDLKTVPVETGYVGGETLFRSNTFSQSYGSDANMLLEQETILRSLFVLYQDIRTLYSELVNTKRHETYLVPDGYNDQIDSYIQQLLNYRAAKVQKEELWKAVTEVTIPAMQLQASLLQRMNDLTDSVQNVINDESSNITPKLTQGLTATNSLQDTFEGADTYLTADKKRKTDTTSLAAEIESLAHSLPTSDIANQIISDAQDIQEKMTPHQDYFITLGNLTAIRQNIAPAMGLFRQLDAHKIIQMTTITNLKAILDNKFSTVTQQIKAKQAEADKMQLDIELTKKNIQTIEGRLKVLMPSIDLNNPDNKWSVLVNIQSGSNT